MLRTLQAIDWGLLPPYPIAIHPRVTTLVGTNGSGKSSAMDAIKAALGCSRFGQGRGCASYLNSGRGNHAPARESFVLVCCTLPEDRRAPTFADEHGNFTLLLWVTRSRRLHMALPGHLLLGMGDADLHGDIETLKERYPRKVWQRPEEFQSRVLDPLGASAAVQRLLEIPQGETQRLLEARPDRLLRDLLGLMGALEPLEQLTERRSEYQEAQAERDRAKRAVLEEELALAHAQRQQDDDGRLASVTEQLAAVSARSRGAAHAALAGIERDLAEHRRQAEMISRQLPAAREELEQAKQRQRAVAAAPEDWQHAARAVKQLNAKKIRCEVVAAALDPAWATPAQVSALRHLVCCVVVEDSCWTQLEAHIGRYPNVHFVRANAGSENLAADWWRSVLTDSQMHEHDTHVQVGDRAYVPRLDVQLPLQADADDLAEAARARLWNLQRQADQHAGAEAELERRRDELAGVLRTLGDGETLDADAEELPGLLAERRRLSAQVAELQAAEARRHEQRRRLERQQQRLAEAKQFLEGQEGALEEAREALTAARTFYQQQVRQLIAALDTHFRELCEAASMRGELELTEDALAEAGGRLNIRVAESPTAPLRSYHGEADLSGGWRAKTSVLVLLAALCAAGGEHVLPVACLDEHSAALDEDRIAELGWVFQRLARERGLQIICAMPTKRSAEQSSWCDQQIGFLKAAPDAAYAPLPHIIEAPDDATVPPPVP